MRDATTPSYRTSAILRLYSYEYNSYEFSSSQSLYRGTPLLLLYFSIWWVSLEGYVPGTRYVVLYCPKIQDRSGLGTFCVKNMRDVIIS